MTTREIIQSKKFKIIASVTGAIVLLIISFAAGVHVGYRKARYSYQWGANYERDFGGPRMGMNGPVGRFAHDFSGQNFRNGYGLAGTVVSVSGNNIIVKDRDNQENTVSVSDKTLIKSGSSDLKVSNLVAGQRIIVMGNPASNGVINADLIRVFNDNNNNNSNDTNGAPSQNSTPAAPANPSANNSNNNQSN